MIGNGHLVKRHLLGVFKETIGSPDRVKPLDVENAILFAHVLRQSESRVPPALREKNVSYISHTFLIDRINGKHGDVKIYNGRLTEELRRSIFIVTSRLQWKNVGKL